MSRWRFTVDVWVEAANEEEAKKARDRIGDDIEDHPMVVGCEDSPVKRDES